MAADVSRMWTQLSCGCMLEGALGTEQCACRWPMEANTRATYARNVQLGTENSDVLRMWKQLSCKSVARWT